MDLAWSCSATRTTFKRYYLSPCDEILAAAGARVTLSQANATPQTQAHILASKEF